MKSQNIQEEIKDIYFYSVGYSSYEEAPSIILFSHKKYSKQEFMNICAEASMKVYDKIHEYKDINEYIKYIEDENELLTEEEQGMLRGFSVKFDEIYRYVTKELCKNYGFKEIKIENLFMPFGWSNIVDETDWANDTMNDFDLQRIRDYIFTKKRLLSEKIKIKSL